MIELHIEGPYKNVSGPRYRLWRNIESSQL